MKTLRKIDIEMMEKELQVLENPQQILGGTKGDASDPYTQAEFESMLASGVWTGGGFVSGVGYVHSEVTVTGSVSGSVNGRYNSSFHAGAAGASLTEGVGINAACFMDGTVTETGGGDKVSISATMAGAMVSSADNVFGSATLYVNGKKVKTIGFDIPEGGLIYPTGTNPLGNASFDLSKYEGNIAIVVEGGYNTNAPEGMQYGNVQETVVYNCIR